MKEKERVVYTVRKLIDDVKKNSISWEVASRLIAKLADKVEEDEELFYVLNNISGCFSVEEASMFVASL